MSGIDERIAELSPKRRELLARLLQKERAGVAHAAIRPRRRDASASPLSFAQQRLWLIDQLEPDNASYNTFVSLDLEGTLDADALTAAVNEIIRRHETLRTTFINAGESPAQVVAASLSLTPTVVDLSATAEHEREAAAVRLANAEADRPFDLQRGPLLRVTLLRMNVQRHVLLVTMHHIVTDGWSLDIFIKELSAAYQAYATGQTPRLPELPVQYADYAAWQREWLSGGALDEQLSYWRGQLSGRPGVLELPTDHTRPAAMSYRGAVRTLALPAALNEKLKTLARREGATLYMTLLAAFNVLLARYTGQTDISIGTPIAGRTRAEIENLIGFFVNTLVLRTDLSGSPSFRELLGRVREVALGAYAHQDVPFERLVEELQPARSLSHTPLFQVMFALQSGFDIMPKLPGLNVTLFEADVSVSQFDLSLDIIEDGDRLLCEMQYRTDLFEAATIERMLEHYRTLLEAIVADPRQSVRELPLLTDAERRRALFEWNDTRREYPHDTCIHELFEQQAARTPQSVAVTCGGQRITYGELNARANRLARHLEAFGVTSETRVGILLENSIEMPLALLGILKAGGAYVALDAAYPPERLLYMLEDAGVEVLLVHRATLDAIEPERARVVQVDAEWAAIAEQSATDVRGRAVAGNLAYLVYTSGTTGQPKGILVPHRAIVNTALAFVNQHRLTEQDRLLQFASLSFDVAAEEFFAAWLSGGCAVMRSVSVLETQAEFVGLLERERVTVVNLPASFWSEWLSALAEGDSHVPESLRRVVVGNEKTLEETLSKWRRIAGERVGWSNAYGPTETTVTASNYEPDASALARGATSIVPIGRPVMNASMYILDEMRRIVPVGVAGELYIGGAGLARGYHRQAALTAERFVPHPFSRTGGERLYRTGDVARYLADGNVEFLGRADEQVKVRGFRVELGEVEAVLAAHPSVRELTVAAREAAHVGNQLVAYVALKANDATTASDLRSHMQQRLPDYMLPSAFVLLEALPLTPNGKVDRRALPAPEGETASASAPPRTPVEEMLAGIWCEILNVRRINRTDNFFELGGHSLLATRVVSRVRHVYGIELPLRLLFESPTVERLAAHIELMLKQGAQRQVSPINPASRKLDVPLSFAQQRLWLLHQLEPADTSYNMPDAVRLKGRLNVPALQQSFGEIVRRHEILRTTFQTIDGEPRQIIAPHAPLTLDIVDLSLLPPRLRDEEMQRHARHEAQQPFDLAHDSLLRLRLLKLHDDEYVLLITMHHIISDGWSFAVMMHELSTLYAAYEAGDESPLAELGIQYADYAVWQREWLQGEVLDEQLGYWREQLGGELPTLELPTDRVRPATHTYRGAGEYLELSPALVENLKTLSRREGVTLYMTLLAAFNVLLARYSGQADICIGTPIAGRTRAETEELIGFFVNTLVLRADMSGNPGFREFLAQVRERSLGAYVHQDVPFERLVEELQPSRSLSHTPLFQVMFMLQNAPVGELKLQDLTLSEIDTGVSTAKYDLSLSMTESEEGLNGSLIYNTDLFDAETIQRLLRHFQTLLEAVAADPQRRLSDLSLLTGDERRQLLVEFNDTERDYPREQTIQELFEEQAARRPESLALRCDGQQMSYGELNARANQLAHYLRKRGVGPEATVGILSGRSLELVVGMLAVLKAGGAFVPLDYHHPPQRLASMLEETGARVLLTQERMRDRLPEFNGEVLSLDGEQSLFDGEPTTNPEARNPPEHLAFIYHTSGSTGRPKGVLAVHRGVVNYLAFVAGNYELSERDVVLQVASLTFDASVRDILGTLAGGAKLVLVGDEDARDPLALLRQIEAQGVTCILSIVPTLLRSLVETAAEGVRPGATLRLILASGENLLFSECERARSVFGPQLSLVNQYGATECTMSQTFHRVRETEAQGVVPAGRPISNTQVFILDGRLEPCPVGVAGEVHIGGAGLARGYLRSPELTALKYIPHPHAREAGARLYKTGDRARYLPDGRIELLGRLDQQLKVRGMRIEPGEIEGALGAHENVRACVVVAREDAPGDQRLVAYVVLRRTQEGEGLRAHLKERLPAHMLPSAFVVLDALPLTSNGKIDRAALPAPDRSANESAPSFVAPRTPLEESLCGIWAEILGVGRVGVEDNFFELGGHSLLATQVMSRIRKTLQIELPLRALFEQPTVASLAVLLEPGARSELSEMEKIAQILRQVNELSPDEARALLVNRKS